VVLREKTKAGGKTRGKIPWRGVFLKYLRPGTGPEKGGMGDQGAKNSKRKSHWLKRQRNTL